MLTARRENAAKNIETHAQTMPPMSDTSSAIWTLDRWAMKEFRKLDPHFRIDWAVAFLWVAANRDRRVAEVADVPEPQVRTGGVPSGTNLLGLIKHLTRVERFYFLGEAG